MTYKYIYKTPKEFSNIIISKIIAPKRGLKRMSSQAVGWNLICIIILCHRVVGANKSLTGYSEGIKIN